VCLVAVASLPVSALAGDSDGKTIAREGGVGAAAGLASLLYTPTKLLYATGGLVVGGLAFCFSGGDTKVAKTVLTPSTGGDYVITPAQLRGEQRIEFIGRDPNYRRPDYDADTVEPAEIAGLPQGW